MASIRQLIIFSPKLFPTIAVVAVSIAPAAIAKMV
jgi:hypothetical protein